MVSLILHNVIYFLHILLQIYQYVFFVYIILSFFPIDENNFLVRIIRGICEPIYFRLLRVLPPLRISMIDLSPIYMIIFIYIVDFILVRLAQII